ncbi:MAG: NifB/NifX family molybdenum-iron cluster-binding protein [Methanobacteriota archaeon]|jgi:predicted Fe-Mo cluster-binding NifX family protein
MKILVTAKDRGLDAEVDGRFGRCPFFVVVDSSTMAATSVENPGTKATGGAGVAAAQGALDLKPDAILTGEVGPHAMKMLEGSGVKIVTGAKGSVREAVERCTSTETVKISRNATSM